MRRGEIQSGVRSTVFPKRHESVTKSKATRDESQSKIYQSGNKLPHSKISKAARDVVHSQTKRHILMHSNMKGVFSIHGGDNISLGEQMKLFIQVECFSEDSEGLFIFYGTEV